jgi:hypothetical protein
MLRDMKNVRLLKDVYERKAREHYLTEEDEKLGYHVVPPFSCIRGYLVNMLDRNQVQPLRSSGNYRDNPMYTPEVEEYVDIRLLYAVYTLSDKNTLPQHRAHQLWVFASSPLVWHYGRLQLDTIAPISVYTRALLFDDPKKGDAFVTDVIEAILGMPQNENITEMPNIFGEWNKIVQDIELMSYDVTKYSVHPFKGYYLRNVDVNLGQYGVVKSRLYQRRSIKVKNPTANYHTSTTFMHLGDSDAPPMPAEGKELPFILNAYVMRSQINSAVAVLFQALNDETLA